MGFIYVEPSGMTKKGWVRRRFEKSGRTYPTPMCAKTASKYADTRCKQAGLKEFEVECGGGAQFDVNKIISELIGALEKQPNPDQDIHVQFLGDGFRAMKSTSIVSVGARLLVETEEVAGDTSFTGIASL